MFQVQKIRARVCAARVRPSCSRGLRNSATIGRVCAIANCLAPLACECILVIQKSDLIEQRLDLFLQVRCVGKGLEVDCFRPDHYMLAQRCGIFTSPVSTERSERSVWSAIATWH